MSRKLLSKWGFQLRWSGIVLLLLLWNCPVLFAQTPKPGKSDSKVENKVDLKDEKVAQFLETLEIFGRVEKPQTVFIIPGKDPRVDDINIKREFFKEIFRTIEKPTVASKEAKLKDTPYILY
ncbi:hypothetical protein L0128_00215 [candidate division KSB1 bacterium]|nr:hypothetical protein [candidate division KSB1 bacterium]